MNGWWFAHPAALWALLAVPFLWWRARSGARGEAQWTGALAIWRRAVQAASSTDSRERRGLPLSVIAALLAVVLGTLALADPQRRTARAVPLRWTLVLDRSPSMFLAAESTSTSPTRIERAVDLAVACCERAGVAPDAREWSTYAFDGAHAAQGNRPPPKWLEPAWGPGAPTPWTQLDTPEHLWVSDCEPDFAPLKAGRVHCGASPTFGAIADLGPRCLAWDGQQVFEQPWSAARSGVFVGADIPEEIALLAKLWSDERQLTMARESSSACLRLLRADLSSAAHDVEGKLIGDSWSVTARASLPSASGDLSTWAEFEDRERQRSPAVQWRPGEIRIAVSAIAAEEADPAVFALAWVALFDGARLPDPAVVSLTERAQAGPEIVNEPGAAAQPGLADVQSFAPLLAALASALALAALALARQGRAAHPDPWNHAAAPVRSPARVGLG